MSDLKGPLSIVMQSTLIFIQENKNEHFMNISLLKLN